MVGYVRQDSTNDIDNGKVIDAADLDAEFDAIVNAFDNSSGHSHNGNAAEGAPITTLGPTQDVDITATAILPGADNTVDLGSGSLEFKDLYIDGTANIDSLVADTADINGGTVDGAVVGGSTPAAGSFTTLTASGTVTFADNDFTLQDNADTSKQLQFQLSGITTATTRTLTVPDISDTLVTLTATQTLSNKTLTSPTIDLSSITSSGDLAIADGGTGASTASGARTNLGLVIGTDVQAYDAGLDDISGLAVTNGNFIVGDGANWVAESGATARASLGLTIGTDVQAWDADLDVYAANPLAATELAELQNIGTTTISATQWGYLGAMNQGVATTDTVSFADLTATTADINGGTVDGAVIGGASAAAGTFTNLTSTGTSTHATVDINGGAIDGTVIGGNSAAAGTFTTVDTTGNITTDANLIIGDGQATGGGGVGRLRPSGDDFAFSPTDGAGGFDTASDFYFDFSESSWTSLAPLVVNDDVTVNSNRINVYGGGTDVTGSFSDKLILQNTSATSNDVGMKIVAGNAGTSYIQFGDSDNAAFAEIQYDHANDEFYFLGNANQFLGMNSTGAVFGEADISVGDTTTDGVEIGYNGLTNFQRNTSVAANSGVVRVYQGSTMNCEIQADGDLFNTNGTYGTISDGNLKENVVDSNSQLEDIKALRVVNFDWKGKPEKGRHLGVIAQEVEKTSPGLVGKDENGVKNVKTSLIYMKLLKAFQEYVDQTDKKIAQLEARLGNT